MTPPASWRIRTTARKYTSLVYGAYAKQSGIDLSMGSIGDPWDNALAERRARPA